jgi:hypothetical protein
VKACCKQPTEIIPKMIPRITSHLFELEGGVNLLLGGLIITTINPGKSPNKRKKNDHPKPILFLSPTK